MSCKFEGMISVATKQETYEVSLDYEQLNDHIHISNLNY